MVALDTGRCNHTLFQLLRLLGQNIHVHLILLKAKIVMTENMFLVQEYKQPAFFFFFSELLRVILVPAGVNAIGFLAVRAFDSAW